MFVLTNLPLNGPNGSTTITDTTGRVSWLVASSGNTQIQDNALLLDGSGDYIWAGGNPFVFGASEFTVQFDIKTTQSGERVLVDFYQGSGYNVWQLEMLNGALSWYIGNPVGRVYTGTALINDGNWHTVVVERIAGVLYFRVDGVLDGSVADTRNYDYSTSYIGVGAQVTSRNAAYDLAGSIRNFSISKPDAAGAISRAGLIRNIYGWDRGITRVGLRRGVFYPLTPMQTKVFRQFGITRGVPPWWGPSGSTTQLPTYKLRGRVMQRDPDGVLPDAPIQYARVALFFRRLHALVDIQLSDVNGYVQFDNLMPGGQAYYAIAFDPEGAPLQNAVIWDRLTPEPGP